MGQASPIHRGRFRPIHFSRCLGRGVFARVVIEFGSSVAIVCTPVILVPRLAISTSARWLPWLIKGLKVKDVDVPVKSSTDALFEEGKSVRCTCSCSSVV